MAKTKKVSITEFLQRLREKAKTVKFRLDNGKIRSPYYCPLAVVFGDWTNIPTTTMSTQVWSDIANASDNARVFGNNPVNQKLRAKILKAAGLTESKSA